MNTNIQQFFDSAAYAVVGVSRSKNKFGNTIFREMKNKGLTVHPIHPSLSSLDGTPCITSISKLPPDVQSVVVCVHPEDAVTIVGECKGHGIANVWLQQGAESVEAIALASVHSLNLIHGECVLMFLEPVKSIHAVHRWFNKLVGSYPS